MALAEAGRPQVALASYDRAIELQPADVGTRADALANRAGLWARLRNYAEAAADARAALAIDPDHPYTLGNALYFELMQCDWRQRAESVALLEASHGSRRRGSYALCYAHGSASPALQFVSARLYAAAQFAPHDEAAPAPPPPNSRIRLAFVSSDFHEHATAYLITGMIELIDKTRFELFGLSFGPLTEDRYQRRLKAAFDRFVAIHWHSDAEAAG